MIVIGWHIAAVTLAAVDFDWLLIPASFLVGSFPSALLVGRLVGHDPTAEGSGNPGATNMFRIAGLKAGTATLIFDVVKALSAALAGRIADGTTLAAWCGAAAVIGHIFPILRQSRGGKGVACFGGLTIGAWPVLAPIGLALWIGPAKLSGQSFVGALIGVPSVAVGTMVLGRPTAEVLIAWALAVLIVGRHHPNIREFLTDRRG